MTYAEHARLSLTLAALFLQGAVCALAHAVCPFVLGKSSTAYAAEITERIRAAGCQKDEKPLQTDDDPGSLMADKED